MTTLRHGVRVRQQTVGGRGGLLGGERQEDLTYLLLWCNESSSVRRCLPHEVRKRERLPDAAQTARSALPVGQATPYSVEQPHFTQFLLKRLGGVSKNGHPRESMSPQNFGKGWAMFWFREKVWLWAWSHEHSVGHAVGPTRFTCGWPRGVAVEDFAEVCRWLPGV